MNLHGIDIAVVVAYLVTSVLVGYWVSHRASRDIKAYFLGGNVMPWYVLGVSNASGMFDISGTMLLVYWMFVYGLKSVWIPWLWPTFNQIFLMVYLSSWLRRSNVMTGAEWIQTRFGKGRGANLAHIIVVIYAFFSIVGFFTYGFKGIGKFAGSGSSGQRLAISSPYFRGPVNRVVSPASPKLSVAWVRPSSARRAMNSGTERVVTSCNATISGV